jgi:hypothetical protein
VLRDEALAAAAVTDAELAAGHDRGPLQGTPAARSRATTGASHLAVPALPIAAFPTSADPSAA